MQQNTRTQGGNNKMNNVDIEAQHAESIQQSLKMHIEQNLEKGEEIIGERDETENLDDKNVTQNVSALVDSLPFRIIGYTSFLLMNILPFIAIIIGIIYIDQKECPKYPIAALLIASGILALIVNLLQIYMSGRKKSIKAAAATAAAVAVRNQQTSLESNPRLLKPKKQKTWQDWVICFVRFVKLAVFSYTCVVVYKLYPNVVLDKAMIGEDTEFYCNRILYLFSFWTLTTFFIILGLTLFLMCCGLCCGLSILYITSRSHSH